MSAALVALAEEVARGLGAPGGLAAKPLGALTGNRSGVAWTEGRATVRLLLDTNENRKRPTGTLTWESPVHRKHTKVLRVLTADRLVVAMTREIKACRSAYAAARVSRNAEADAIRSAQDAMSAAGMGAEPDDVQLGAGRPPYVSGVVYDGVDRESVPFGAILVEDVPEVVLAARAFIEVRRRLIEKRKAIELEAARERQKETT